MPSTTQAMIGLGGNLGDPSRTLSEALAVLREVPAITACRASRFYRTLPVEATGPDFCNGIAEITTSLSAVQLLELLLSIEMQFGRERTGWHAPRTLDLDLISHGTTRIVSSQLTVPHPRAHARAFVLIPLCELDETVLLGPPEAEGLVSARDWHARLTPADRAEVLPW